VSPLLTGIIGWVSLFVLIALKMPIGLAMALTGILGVVFLSGVEPAFGIIATVPFASVSTYTLAVVPLFVLMGFFALNTGLSEDLFRGVNRMLGDLPG